MLSSSSAAIWGQTPVVDWRAARIGGEALGGAEEVRPAGAVTFGDFIHTRGLLDHLDTVVFRLMKLFWLPHSPRVL